MTHTHNQSQLHSDGVVAQRPLGLLPVQSSTTTTGSNAECTKNEHGSTTIQFIPALNHPVQRLLWYDKQPKSINSPSFTLRQQETSLAANMRFSWHHANDFPKHWRHLTLQQFRSEPLARVRRFSEDASCIHRVPTTHINVTSSYNAAATVSTCLHGSRDFSCVLQSSNQTIWQSTRLRTLPTVCGAATPGFRGEALAAVGNAQGTMHKDLASFAAKHWRTPITKGNDGLKALKKT